MHFLHLCDQLELPEETKTCTLKQLALLKQWCYENISSDLIFSSEKDNDYANYRALARSYLDFFLPKASKNLSKQIPDFLNRSTLAFAASSGLDRYLSSLKVSNNEINQADENLMTPLHLAATKGYFNTVSILLELGADIKKQNKLNHLPLQSSLLLPLDFNQKLKTDKTQIVKLLLSKDNQSLCHKDINGENILHQMSSQGFEQLLSEIVMTNPSLAFERNNLGHYPIHNALLSAELACVKALLSIDRISELKDNHGQTPLHYSARYSGSNILALCIKHADNIDELDSNGKSPLLCAALAGNTSALDRLITHNADVSLCDSKGNTLLHYATLSEDLKTVDWLIKNIKLDINRKNKNGQTPLSLVETGANNEEIELLLLQSGAKKMPLTSRL